ncbi:MAG: CHASE2 domain-containing protein [Bacteroidetes bacterium]|nr:CHASE2 domain-containing protein [Bacteroidota bacterium]MBS1540344.1 CHASE2 domain-containing protein [Bacteroidota bacterium]
MRKFWSSITAVLSGLYHFLKKRTAFFWFRSVSVTAFSFFLMWAFSGLFSLQLFNAFDPVGQALSDFELTDYAFSQLRPQPDVDQRIVLVNFGHIPRLDIAQQLAIINKYKPRVIGIDSYFNCEGGLYDTIRCPQLLDTLANNFLSDAIKEAGNVVLVSKLLQKTATAYNQDMIDEYDSMEVSDPMFDRYSSHGFANLITDASYQEDVKQCRSFIPRMKINGRYENAFAVELAKRYDSTKVKKLFARGNEEEIVNYRGNVELTDIKLKTLQGKDLSTTNFRIMFYALDIEQLMKEEFDSSLLKDKIVILGYLGNYFGDPAWEDKYFTPLNKKVAGRANPDMFGVVVHANIISMILNEDYVGEPPEWATLTIAIVLGILTVALFSIINEKWDMWYDALQVTIQIVQIILISGIMIYAFATYTYKIDLTLSMAVCALVGPAYDFLNPILKKIFEKSAE